MNDLPLKYLCNHCDTVIDKAEVRSHLMAHKMNQGVDATYAKAEPVTTRVENATVTSEVRVTSATGGEKGQKDVRIHALPTEALFELGRVFAFGEQKYADYNFRKGYKWSLSFDALQRHAWAFWNREDNDPESKLHHMAHAAWHCLVMLFYSLTGVGEDDRPQA